MDELTGDKTYKTAMSCHPLYPQMCESTVILFNFDEGKLEPGAWHPPSPGHLLQVFLPNPDHLPE